MRMKKLFIFCLLVLFSQSSFAQTAGTIKYTHNIKLEFELPDGMEIDGLSDNMTLERELHFNGSQSVYKDQPKTESKDKEITSDDGSFKMVIKMDETEEIFFTDLKAKKVIHQTGFMGKEFLIESPLKKSKWKLTGEKIKYLGYVCQKAEMTITEEDKEIDVVAWFTSEIPVPIGPDGYNQLPGAILMVTKDDGKSEIKATEVSFDAPAEEIMIAPKKGKKVTQEEYEKIVEEKTKEMEESFGKDRQGIMIRG